MKHYIYILRSINYKRHYVGYTIDIERRVREHNNGNTKSTRPFKPWKLMYFEEFDDKSEAYKREWHLKHSRGRKEKIEIINNIGEVPAFRLAEAGTPASPKANAARID